MIDPDPSGQSITLTPASAPSGDPTDIVMTVNGRSFTADSLIFFNGLEEPTTYVSPEAVTTGVKPSLFVVPAVCPVHVVTDGVATQSADFTFTGGDSPNMPQLTPEESVTAQLYSWGLTGEPIGWATPRMQPVLYPIRAYNLGFSDLATVQGMLDITYPEFDISAVDVTINRALSGDPAIFTTNHVGAQAGVPAHDHVELLDELGLPAENVTWYLDGVIVGNGSISDLELLPGEHDLEVRVAIAGSVFSATKHVEVPEELSV